jgi:hypothetical protein
LILHQEESKQIHQTDTSVIITSPVWIENNILKLLHRTRRQQFAAFYIVKFSITEQLPESWYVLVNITSSLR